MGNAKLQPSFLQRNAYTQPRLAELPSDPRESLYCIEHTHRKSHSQFASARSPLGVFGFVAGAEVQGPSAGIASRPFVRAGQSMCRVGLFASRHRLFQGPHAALRPMPATSPESVFAVVRPFHQIKSAYFSNKQLHNILTPLLRSSQDFAACPHHNHVPQRYDMPTVGAAPQPREGGRGRRCPV